MKRLGLGLIIAGPFVAAALGVWLTRATPADSTQPLAHGVLASANVLLVSIDALRADHVGAYGTGGALTPAIDQLAAQGLVFDRTYAHVPQTLPSHATLMTARYPYRNGIRVDGGAQLAPDVPTIASAFHAAGYRTAAFVGASVLGARTGLNRGFDEYDDRISRSAAESTAGERTADQVLAPAFEWIAGNDSRWFVWVHLYDPHEPYSPPEPYRSRFSSEPYDGEVAYVDAALGLFLGRLRAAGALGHTLVVVTSDHGESLGEHGELAHGRLAYDATLRVPLIMWALDRIRPGSFSRTMRLVDVAPTVLDLVGLAPLEHADGRSIRPFVAGERPFDDAESYFEAPNEEGIRDGAPVRGLVSGQTKLIEAAVPELYDLAADPAEQNDIYAQQPGRARDLERRLDALTRAPR
ncbi:MAG: sulfatase [Betaproteobacteria bacterium]